ncbi:deoxyribonuclease IV [Nocardioidaceae bacterium]|nr:deoxyribonuclease IV [Nocardioidaceae bacterium]
MRNPIGSHVPVGAGLVKGTLRTAADLGCEAVQVFLGNPRGWKASAGDPAVDAAYAQASREAGVRTFVHAPYLVNLGSPTTATYEKSVGAVAHNLGRTAAIGAEGLVVHTGSSVAEGGFESGLRQVREGLLPLLDTLAGQADREGAYASAGTPGVPRLLLEPTAGQGRSLCAGVEDLGAYLEALDFHPALGICLDTCHVYAAGAPLDEVGGTTATLDRLWEVTARDGVRVPLVLVHANDSKDPRGSMRDRHERIGEGTIGVGAFTELLAHRSTDGVPLVLETPDSNKEAAQVRLLQQLRAA